MSDSLSRDQQQEMDGTETQWIQINCGGQVFETSLKTVTKFPNSKLAGMFRTEAGAEVERTLDLDPQYFSVVLTWLRYGILSLPSNIDLKLLMATAELLGLEELVQEVNREREDVRPDMTDWLRLNVGGKLFETSRTTMISDSDSFLARMFEPDSCLPPAFQTDGVYQIDACPRVFTVILNWLRYRSLMLGDVKPEDVLPSADYFGLKELKRLLERQIRVDSKEKGKILTCIEQSVEGLEEVLQRQGCELSGIKERMGQMKVEVSQVVTGVEDIWRIKCEIARLTECIKTGFEKLK